MVSILHGGLGTLVREALEKISLPMSPSHTLGSEHRKNAKRRMKARVTIPHGGLRTLELSEYEAYGFLSSSHTVGSERETLLFLPERPVCHHPTRWAQNRGPCVHGGNNIPMSSSHTVGSELLKASGTEWEIEVTIPHGGLGTRRFKQWPR